MNLRRHKPLIQLLSQYLIQQKQIMGSMTHFSKAQPYSKDAKNARPNRSKSVTDKEENDDSQQKKNEEESDKLIEEINKIDKEIDDTKNRLKTTKELYHKMKGIKQRPLPSSLSSPSTSEPQARSIKQNVEDLAPMIINNGTHNRLPVKKQIPDYVPILPCIKVAKRPLFPGYYKTILLKDPKTINWLQSSLKKGVPYIGIFLSKPSNKSEVFTDKEEGNGEEEGNIREMSEIYPVGAFASVISLLPTMSEDGAHQYMSCIVYPHRRIIARELVPSLSSTKEDHHGFEGGVGRPSTQKTPLNKLRVDNMSEATEAKDEVAKAIVSEIFSVLSELVKLNSFFRQHILHLNTSSSVFESPSLLADFLGVLVNGEASELQKILESTDIKDRLKTGLTLLKKELIQAKIQAKISADIDEKISAKAREHYLHEQLKLIKKELGLETDSKEKIIQGLKEKAEKLVMPDAVKKIFEEELGKLSVIEAVGMEFNLTRNYLDWIVNIPWGLTTTDTYDYHFASQVLDEDHYGLEEIKERILEFIAVSKLRQTQSHSGSYGKILCFVGPPGVGKTSLGRSIARALGRKYYRFSVGGLADVSEIKGHRRTYIGALPGKPIQSLKTSGSMNPLILIDEIDKLGHASHHGDPSAALLELLDPEQNTGFNDYYLDLPVDFSKVLFVCTANTTESIPPPLLDRMEVIHLSGYILDEKLKIAEKYLIPNAIKECGLTSGQVYLEDDVLKTLILGYAREAGVRNLKKFVEKIFRKAALKLVKENKLPIETSFIEPPENATNSQNGEGGGGSLTCAPSSPLLKIGKDQLTEYVGNPVFTSDRLYTTTPVGVVMGLAWTSLGGTVMYVETLLENTPSFNISLTQSINRSGGQLTRTGQLGKVMEESSSIAYSFSKSYLLKLQLKEIWERFESAKIHLHVPEGATPKDGPSAGITMATSLLSLALGKPVKSELAMTGELSLTGKVLKIGGLKEKIIAAKLANVKNILFPTANEADWVALPEHIKEGLTPWMVENYDQVYTICFDGRDTHVEPSKNE